MDFDEVVKKRTSIRKFAGKKPPIDKITEIIEISNLAPTAGNIQTTRFIIIEDPEKINLIADSCQQPFIQNAPTVLIVCSDKNQLVKLYDERAEKYNKQQVGAAIENILLKVTNDRMAACWVGAFSEPLIRNSLQIPDNVEIEVIIPLGYEMTEGKTIQKRKHSLVNRIFFESFGNRFYKPIKKLRRDDM